MTARAPLPPVTLGGRRVRLEPLTPDHVDALVAAASVDRSTYEWTTVPDGREAMEQYVSNLLAEHAAGNTLPFVQCRATDGAVLGCTRLMEPRWWTRREFPDEVEVGGTWLTAAAQRTGVNTEAKLLLLGHAFDSYGCWRVAIATDARNARSRAAIERIGATFEGVLRNHRLRQGDHLEPGSPPRPRDTAMFSITRDEWPSVAAALRARLAG